MTAEQMRYEFDVSYDKITNFDAPGYEPKEISTFLTKAQEEITLEIMDGDAYLEMNKKVLNKLKITNSQIESGTPHTAGPYPNSFYRELPDNMLRVINDRLDLLATENHFYASLEFEDVKVIPIDDDYYHLNKNNPYKKPSHDLAWRLDYGVLDTTYKRRHVYLLEPELSIVTSYIHYYRKPEPIIVKDSSYDANDGSIDGKTFLTYKAMNLDCELDPLVHRKIVDRAVKLAYAALQDEKGFQISSVQEQQK